MVAIALKKLRKSKKLTQDELADLLCVSRSAISLYETGRREPDCAMLSKMADVFGVSVDFLLGRIAFEENIMVQNFFRMPVEYKQQVIKLINSRVS